MVAVISDRMLLRTSGLTKRFGGVPALDDVGFAAGKGEVTALIGPKIGRAHV